MVFGLADPGLDEGGNFRLNITPPAGSRAAENAGAINFVPEFVANELLGIDDLVRGYRAARSGDWGQFARSLVAFGAEGGLTALSILAAVPSGGTSVAARVGAAAARQGATQAGRAVTRRVGRNAARTVVGRGRGRPAGVVPSANRSTPWAYDATFNGRTATFGANPRANILAQNPLYQAGRYAATGRSGWIGGLRVTPFGASRPVRLVMGNYRFRSPILRGIIRDQASDLSTEWWQPQVIAAAEEAAAADAAGAGDRGSDIIEDIFGPGAGDGGGGGGAGGGGGIPGMGDYRAIADRMAELLPLGPTEQELTYLAQQLERLDAFQRAGDLALESEWAKLEKANYAAAERAVQMGAQYGPEAKQIWSQVAQDALLITQARGEAAAIEGGFEYTPSAAAGDWTALTGVIGQSEADLAQARAATTARDLEWLGATAASTGTALRGQLQNAIVRAKADEAKQFNQMIMERDARRQEQIAEATFSAEMAAMNAQAAAAARAAEEPEVDAYTELANYAWDMVSTVGRDGAVEALKQRGLPQDAAEWWADQAQAALEAIG